MRRRSVLVKIVLIALAGSSWVAVRAQSVLPRPQVAEPVVRLASLKTVPIPEPPDLNQYVRDRRWAIVLGKALFWDMQVGSDGIQACASCHFSAGADMRSKNSVSPAAGRAIAGTYGEWISTPSSVFSLGAAPNYQLRPEDFPLRKLIDPTNRLSPAASDKDIVVSSAGIFKLEFLGIRPVGPLERVRVLPDSIFHVARVNVRQVLHRSTPSVINAVFNHRQFWDGRAQAEFNGVNIWGDRDQDAKVVVADGSGQLQWKRIRLTNASLASQAVAPITSSREASAAGRDFQDIAIKLTPSNKKGEDSGRLLGPVRPLGFQLVAPDDSVLGPYSAFPGRGLRADTAGSYEQLVQKAFHERWWKSAMRVLVEADGTARFMVANALPSRDSDDRFPRAYTLLEYNFSLFLALAIQMYESTLISDQTPFDRHMEAIAAGQTSTALSEKQLEGLAIFNSNRGRCVNCHGGAELTNASVAHVSTKPLFRRESVADLGLRNVLETGFNNIGVRPIEDDPGVGSNDPFGAPLSLARQVKKNLWQPPPLNPTLDLVNWDSNLGVDGAFKTPGLRNVELTAPYFHNGGQLTLRQVIDFYDRGGDFEPIQTQDGRTIPLRVLGLAETEKKALEAFLLALTDERVRFERAPFDHPELFVPNGHMGNTSQVINVGTGTALDQFLWIRMVGKTGRVTPLKGFLQ